MLQAEKAKKMEATPTKEYFAAIRKATADRMQQRNEYLERLTGMNATERYQAYETSNGVRL